MATDLAEVQKKLWDAADALRANSGLQASGYSQPVLGLIFLRFAEQRFAAAEAEIGPGSTRNPTGPDDYKAKGVLFLPAEARYGHLLEQPENADLGRVINIVVKAVAGFQRGRRDTSHRGSRRQVSGWLRTRPSALQATDNRRVYQLARHNTRTPCRV